MAAHPGTSLVLCSCVFMNPERSLSLSTDFSRELRDNTVGHFFLSTLAIHDTHKSLRVGAFSPEAEVAEVVWCDLKKGLEAHS